MLAFCSLLVNLVKVFQSHLIRSTFVESAICTSKKHNQCNSSTGKLRIACWVYIVWIQVLFFQDELTRVFDIAALLQSKNILTLKFMYGFVVISLVIMLLIFMDGIAKTLQTVRYVISSVLDSSSFFYIATFDKFKLPGICFIFFFRFVGMPLLL